MLVVGFLLAFIGLVLGKGLIVFFHYIYAILTTQCLVKLVLGSAAPRMVEPGITSPVLNGCH